MSAPVVLMIEDEPNLRELVSDVLAQDGLHVEGVGSIAEGQAFLSTRAPDVLLLDVKLPDGDGIELLSALRRRGVDTPAVVITAFGTVERAVGALRAGAADFLVKPFDTDRLRGAVAQAHARGQRAEEAAWHAPEPLPSAHEAARGLVSDGGLDEVVGLIPRVAATDATVLVLGESGTGKELVARAIHDASGRADGPFVGLNCAALPASLIESELFGFERGAFTGAHAAKKGLFEAAEGGTVFLDEVGDMPLEAQAKLLRVLQEREVVRVGGTSPVPVDVRVVAATHRDLAARVAEGRFREDLRFRLDVVPLHLPPLRDRPEDIPGLVEHFLARLSARHGVPAPRVSEDVQRGLLEHRWPGNVRELENWVERSLVLGRFEAPAGPRATPVAAAPAPAPDVVSAPASEAVPTLRAAVAAAERATVVAALRATGGNKTKAARLLGVSYKTLFNKIHEHDIKEARKIE